MPARAHAHREGSRHRPPAAEDPLEAFRPATRAWFRSTFAAPTPAQARGWPAITAGQHTLICAPTGSGKTLAAFLWCLDRLHGAEPDPDPTRRLRVLYVSPLKALAYDIERNLQGPLVGIARAAEALGEPPRAVRVAMRTGDTPADERRTLARFPPDILVTTPESLYLLLTSASRDILRTVEWVIVDEIHAVAATKRGAHLALSLERLEALTERAPQRIGLSATQRPLSVVASFLGGRQPIAGAPGADRTDEIETPPRPVTIVDAGVRKPLDLRVVVPVEDMSRLGEAIPLDEAPGGPAAGPEQRFSIWPAIHPRILELIRTHRSTIVFVNSRRLAERLALRLNELAGEELVRAHHGSLAREERVEIEEGLKAGRLPAIVATSSLELGIDMGAVDLVVQVESPLSVSRGLQRVGRAGHAVDEPSRGVLFPKHRGDLLESAVVVRAMREGAIESTTLPRNPLDVLAQQIVAAAVERRWPVEDLYALVRRAESFAGLGREVFEGVLAMLSGAFPSDEFAELRPRIVWDRVEGTVRARGDARMVAVTSGGTIPDRGLFGVYLDEDPESPGGAAASEGRAPSRARAAGRGGRRVGELDEEMVYETRPGEVILLGASAWRIERITRDRVLVSPAPGEPGKVPFWHGEGPGRPVELGRTLGAFVRELGGMLEAGDSGRRAATRLLHDDYDLDELAAANLVGYLDEERAATGALPTDRTIVIERFRDELGDWRVCILTPFGARVHAPWALAIEARLREHLGLDVQPIWSDDGIVVRLPATEATRDAWSDAPGPEADEAGRASGNTHAPVGGAGAVEEAVLIDPEAIEDLVVGALGGSTLFAARFRENAARALLLPRQRAGQRRPLWQMRQRAAQLLAVAARYGSFPVILETYRECLQDVFDLPALREILESIRSRRIAVHSVETTRASPFAGSLLFDYIAAYMYEGDAPLADRRAQALALDRELLRELLGAEELRELLDADALADLELELQGLTPERAATSADRLHDLLRRIGDLTDEEAAARVVADGEGSRRESARTWLRQLEAERRVVPVRVAGEARWIAAEDAGRYRDALGTAPPPGVPAAYLVGGADPLGGLVARWARAHGPFTPADPARRWGLPALAVERALERLLEAGTVVRGEFRPGGAEREWCDPEVLRILRRRSLARLRREVEPVEPAAYARFLLGWQRVDTGGTRGDGEAFAIDRPGAIDRLVEVVAQLEGLPLPWSVLERDVLPLRVRGYAPRLLDELGAAGEIAWVGQGRLGRDDGRVGLYRPDRLRLLWGGPDPSSEPNGWLHESLLGHLERSGASFYRDLVRAAAAGAHAAGEAPPGERALLDAIWDLVWAGRIANDTFAPLRALRWRRSARGSPPRGAARLVPPEAAGRWSLVDGAIAAAPTERRHAQALVLLDRLGVVTRDGVAAEAPVGGFAGVYPVLRELEERGRIRRGYFVEGLGGAQFALPGAVDRLRAERRLPDTGPSQPAAILVAATDPAQPYGSTLAWPGAVASDRASPSRTAGAYVVLVDGEPALYLERGGRALTTFAPFGIAAGGAIRALATLVSDGRVRLLQVERVDGSPVGESPHRTLLEEAGFRRGYRGWVLGPRA